MESKKLYCPDFHVAMLLDVKQISQWDALMYDLKGWDFVVILRWKYLLQAPL